MFINLLEHHNFLVYDQKMKYSIQTILQELCHNTPNIANFKNKAIQKLDGVGPVDNRPSTD